MLQLSQRALTASDADAELFVDRDELAAVERALTLGFSTFLMGQAGSGKTSLLRRLESRHAGRSVLVNAARIGTFADLMAQLANDIRMSGMASDPDHERDSGESSDAVVALRAAALEHGGDRAPVVLLDGLVDGLRHELFGRQRDELWEVPLRWVVTGRSPLTAPADTFFESTVVLEGLGPLAMQEILMRRAATGSADERARLTALAASLPRLLEPTTPRQLLAWARTVLLSPDPDTALEELRAQRKALVHVSPTAGRVFEALGSLGPTHAGDERLLTEIGTTRSRIVQVFKELEDAGLVRGVRNGKRKLYGPDSCADLDFEDPASSEIAAIRVKRHAK